MITQETLQEGCRICPHCEGKGYTIWTWSDRPDENHKCYDCDGTGFFHPIDVPAIMAAIKGRKGLRSSRPSRDKGHRAYYVWRMARFHGGVDVTMPFMASLDCGNDPFRAELDAIADHVAKAVFGTDLAAAYRWGSALGMIDKPAPAGLPLTAYPNGPEKMG